MFLEYISKPSREPLFPPRPLSLPSSFDTPRLVVRWSKAVDRGVCPPISKHSRGAYVGGNLKKKKKTQLNISHCVTQLTPAVRWPTSTEPIPQAAVTVK